MWSAVRLEFDFGNVDVDQNDAFIDREWGFIGGCLFALVDPKRGRALM
jgi:hypothetical protein